LPENQPDVMQETAGVKAAARYTEYRRFKVATERPIPRP